MVQVESQPDKRRQWGYLLDAELRESQSSGGSSEMKAESCQARITQTQQQLLNSLAHSPQETPATHTPQRGCEKPWDKGITVGRGQHSVQLVPPRVTPGREGKIERLHQAQRDVRTWYHPHGRPHGFPERPRLPDSSYPQLDLLLVCRGR